MLLCSYSLIATASSFSTTVVLCSLVLVIEAMRHWFHKQCLRCYFTSYFFLSFVVYSVNMTLDSTNLYSNLSFFDCFAKKHRHKQGYDDAFEADLFGQK